MNRMTRMLVFAVALLSAHICSAAEIKTVKEMVRVPMAMELRDRGVFKNIAGRLELDYGYGNSITVVTFTVDIFNPEKVIPIPTIYRVTLKSIRAKGIYYIEGENQYGIKISGTVDTTIETKPKIDFLLEGGLQIVNISRDGRIFAKKYLPNVDLGWDY